uniref:Uncharacterized protein n=1 Tax=Plectus sambesii TaxID=2011161 RepID=A0A914WRI5_9BILA
MDKQFGAHVPRTYHLVHCHTLVPDNDIHLKRRKAHDHARANTSAFDRRRRLHRGRRRAVTMAHPPSQQRPQRVSYFRQQKRWPILLTCGSLAVFTGTVLFLFGVVGFSEYEGNATRNWICLTMGLVVCASGMAMLMFGRKLIRSQPPFPSSTPHRRHPQRRRRRPYVHPADRPVNPIIWSTPPMAINPSFPPPPSYQEAVSSETYSAQSPFRSVSTVSVSLPDALAPIIESPPPYEESEQRRPRGRSTDV